MSLMFASGIAQVQTEFHSEAGALATLAMAVYVLGSGSGRVVFAPLSELMAAW